MDTEKLTHVLRFALRALEENHHIVADHARHGIVMEHYMAIHEVKEALREM